MLVFFGTSHRSARFLERAVQNGLKIDLLISQPPKRTGRKQILTENPTVTIAKKQQIPFITSLNDLSSNISLRHPNSQQTIGLILDFNQIIPQEIINLFSQGIINIHFSRLPQYRGPAPIQTTILNGDKEAWITYYFINDKIDLGKIIFQSSISLDFTETTDSLYEKLINKASEEINQVIIGLIEKKYLPFEQKGVSSLTKKLIVENCQINWQKPAAEIERLIRAAYSEPGAWCFVRLDIGGSILEKRLKIIKAHLEKGKLVLDLVQLEGKDPVSWKQFQEGYPQAKIDF